MCARVSDHVLYRYMHVLATHRIIQSDEKRVCVHVCVCVCVGLARTIYIRCTYGIFGLEITKYTVHIYVYIRFWPTLCVCVYACIMHT